jgi:hypothetical protein
MLAGACAGIAQTRGRSAAAREDGPSRARPADECLTDSLSLNTGIYQLTGELVPLGGYCSNWRVVADPSPNTAEPRPSSSIAVYPGWADPLPNSRWISSYPTAANDTNGTYTFETCFCVKEGATNPRLHLELLADDRAKCYLNGQFIGQTALSYAFHNPPAIIDTNIAKLIQPGRNCLRIEVENTNSVAMGLDVNGYVVSDGVGYEKPNCCDPTGTIMGMKFWDKNCNGKQDQGEPGLPNWTITLDGGQTTTTDALGNYYFTNVPAGVHVINEVQQPGWNQSAPSSGSYTVTLGAGQVLANLNFGNCKVDVQEGCFKFVEQTIHCTPNGYQACFQVLNQSGFPATYFTMVATAPSGVTISPATLVFSPAVAPNAVSPQNCVTISGPSATPGTTVTIVVRMCDKTRQRCCTDSIRFTLPQCPVFDCCSNFKKAFYKLTNSASSNGLATLGGYLSAGAPSMTRVSATIIQSTINSKPAYGYFVPGVGNNVITGFGSGTFAVAPYSHEVNWGPAGPINLNAPTPFSLKMQFPPVVGLRDTLRYWIRFRYTDANCVTCDTVVAFTRVRYKFIILDGGVLDHLHLKSRKGDDRSLQSSDGMGIGGALHGADSGSLAIVLPTVPPELGSVVFTGIAIQPEDVDLADVVSDPSNDWIVANGGAMADFSMAPGSSIGIGMKYDALGSRSSVRHHLVFSYAANGDTTQEEVVVTLRRDGLTGGDKLTPEVASLGGVRTYALHISNANGSQEPISRLVIATKDGAKVLAVGPTASDSVVALNFAANGVGEFGRDAVTLDPGASRNPIYLTLSGVDGNTTTVHFVTMNADNQTISEGDVTLSSPASSVRDDDGETATAGAMLGQSYPNPAGHSATIDFTLPSGTGSVVLILSDASGREVMRPIDGEALSAGNHAVFVETSSLASGTYYYTLRAAGRTETRSMQVVK